MRKGIMLCYPFEEKRLHKWGAPYIVQPKLDGDRCRALIGSTGQCTLLSSEENVIKSVPHINSALEALHLRNVELDGELYVHGAPHEDIHSIVSREVNLHSDSKYMQYHIFDVVTEEKQYYRLSTLLNLFRDCIYPPATPRFTDNSPLIRVPHFVAHDFDEVMEYLEHFISEKYEGIIVRHPLAPYVRKRSINMMKFKPHREDVYVIVGTTEEISKDGVPKGTLGALVCQGDDETIFNVGSGSFLTQDNRRMLWEMKEKLPGKLAFIKYQHLTKTGGVPRFPVLIDVEGI